MNNELNRTKAASLNAVTMMVTQIIGLILKFGVQTTFIHVLSQSYLGLNGLFANVISFLSFADLGIGTAITVALYKPIAVNNITQIKILVDFYRRVYRVIIIVVSVVGIFISPFIHLLIKDSVFSNTQLMIWFLIYLASTIATYFSAYKRSFLMATQQGYLNSLNDFVFKSIQQILQMVVIVIFKSFLLFLIIQMVAAVLGNIQLSRMATRHYSQVFGKDSVSTKNKKMSSKILLKIKKNVVGAISSKIGEIVVFGTDNIILSAFVGLASVAKYSNYMLIVNSISSLFSQVLGSFIGSIGNLHATSTVDRQEIVIYRIMYLNAVINLFVSTGLGFAFNSFIYLWAGKSYLLSATITIMIVLNYSLNQSRYAIQNFISGMGLYWSLRWKSIIEALINLFLSMFLVLNLHYGVLGVVMGTLGSNLIINVIWEPYIVFHDGLNKSMKNYFMKYVLYELFTSTVIVLMVIISNAFINLNIFQLIFYTIIAEICVFIVFIAGTFKMDEFKYYLRLIPSIIRR